jgi:FAD:protein FMN transferase
MISWANRQWRALGSLSDLMVCGEDPDAIADGLIADVERLEACWSRFRPDSELSELNRADGRWFPVSPMLWTALTKAREAWIKTDGLFDPTIHNRLVALGYDRTFREVSPTGVLVDARRDSIGFGHVLFDDDARAVQVPPAMAIDLGGIGKGLAADLISARAIEHGATSVCLGMGGDIRARGPGPDEDETWKIEVQHPVDDRVIGAFPLANEALVQSATLSRHWERNGVALHHLIDPRTGMPSHTDLIGAVVTAPDAWWAEVVAKSAILLGGTAGLAFLIRCAVDGWLICEDGSMLSTPAVAADLEMA